MDNSLTFSITIILHSFCRFQVIPTFFSCVSVSMAVAVAMSVAMSVAFFDLIYGIEMNFPTHTLYLFRRLHGV